MAQPDHVGYSGVPPSNVRASDGTPPTWRILVVDDDPHEVEICRIALESVYGYEVAIELYSVEALKRAREWRPDLIILDIVMPQMDGFQLARRLIEDGCRANLMFLTSNKEQEAEVTGLQLADDFVMKPLASRRFLARVDLILRRRQSGVAGESSRQVERGANRSLPVIDRVTRFAHVPHGKDTTLTPIELHLLLRLLDDANKLVPYEELLKAVWELSDEHDPRRGEKHHPNRAMLHTHLSRIREKIELNPKQPELIINTQRVGYTYVLKPDPE